MAAFGGRGMPPPGGGGKRGPRHRWFLIPLLTPPHLPWDATPFGRASKCEGPTGTSGAPRYTLDRSGAFRSGELPPCAVWPRTVMRGKLRKLTSGPNSVPKPARRTEPSPRTPVSPRNRRASRRKGGGVKGKGENRRGNHTVPAFPSVDTLAAVDRRLRRTAAMPGLPIGSQSRLRRQAAGTAEPLTLCRGYRKQKESLSALFRTGIRCPRGRPRR